MYRLKTILSRNAFRATAVLSFAMLGALVPAARAQISIHVGIQPTCQYGYYDYAPYACAPVGFYGSGYFYNGIFLGMGPWAGWGYGHGWGGHRFVDRGGGHYRGGGGEIANRNYQQGNRGDRPGGNAGRNEPQRSAPQRNEPQRNAPVARPRNDAPRSNSPVGRPDEGGRPSGGARPNAGSRPGGGGQPGGGRPSGGARPGGGGHPEGGGGRPHEEKKP